MRKGATRNLWSSHEDIILEDHYPAGGAHACQPHLPDRTLPSIRCRALTLGISRHHPYRDNLLTLLERKPMTGYEIAKRLSKDQRQTYETLHDLEQQGVVRKIMTGRPHPAFLFTLAHEPKAAD